jgi:hypothetical protein
MKSIDQVERLLGQTPAPRVVEGPHREQLKQRLLESAQSAQPRRTHMSRSLLSRMSPMMKVAAGFVLAAVLIGTGWAAGKNDWKWTGISFTLETSPETHPGRSVTLPDGATLNLGEKAFTYEESGRVSPDATKAVERANRHHEEENKLIAEKKYKLLKTVELFSEKRYVYRFIFADGSNEKTTVQIPLETVTSWDDYRQKEKEQNEKICKAVAEGKFRLIDVNTTEHQICRDVASNIKFDVRRMRYPGQKDLAQATVEAAKGPTPTQEMSWQDHLQAIRDGKRELLGWRNETFYTYEAVLENGSTATFFQDHPLEKLENEGK